MTVRLAPTILLPSHTFFYLEDLRLSSHQNNSILRPEYLWLQQWNDYKLKTIHL